MKIALSVIIPQIPQSTKAAQRAVSHGNTTRLRNITACKGEELVACSKEVEAFGDSEGKSTGRLVPAPGHSQRSHQYHSTNEQFFVEKAYRINSFIVTQI
jgi:hypothetical protein